MVQTISARQSDCCLASCVRRKYEAHAQFANTAAPGTAPTMRSMPVLGRSGPSSRRCVGCQVAHPGSRPGPRCPAPAANASALLPGSFEQRRNRRPITGVAVADLLHHRGRKRRPPRTFSRYSSISSAGAPARRAPAAVTACFMDGIRAPSGPPPSRGPTGVSGRMPWPRLKIWPGRVPVRFSSSCTGLSVPAVAQTRAAGSIVPCTATGKLISIPGLVDVDPPVDAHHVAPGSMQFAEEARHASAAKCDHRNAAVERQPLNQRSARVRRNIAHIIVRTQRAGQESNTWMALAPRFTCIDAERPEQSTSLPISGATASRRCTFNCLVIQEAARAAAFDHVAASVNGAPTKPINRHLSGPATSPNRTGGLADVAQIVRIGDRERIHVVSKCAQDVDLRTLAGGVVKVFGPIRLRPAAAVGEK